MRVVMPHAGRPDHGAYAAAVLAGVAFVDVGRSPLAYWDVLRALWAMAEDFVLVEHDIVITPGTISTFEECPHLWCSCPPPGIVGLSRRRESRPPATSVLTGTDSDNGWTQAFLQCNRFRRDLMLRYPSLLTDVAAPNRYWLVLDEHTIGRLPAQCHVHHDRRTRHAQSDPARMDTRRPAYVEWAMTHYPDTWVDSANGSVERQRRRFEAATWLATRS